MFTLDHHENSHHKFMFTPKAVIDDEVAGEIIKWCNEKFGGRKTWNYDSRGMLVDCPIKWQRWHVVIRSRAYCLFFFRDYQDAFEFRMRWC